MTHAPRRHHTIRHPAGSMKGADMWILRPDLTLGDYHATGKRGHGVE
jgi:hypothetical protein